MKTFGRIGGWLMQFAQPKQSLVAMIVAPFATILGAFFATCGVVACGAVHPDRISDTLVRYGVYGVLSIFIVSAVSLALLSMVLLNMVVFRGIVGVYRWIKGSEPRSRRSARGPQHSVATGTADEAGTPANENIVPLRRRSAGA